MTNALNRLSRCRNWIFDMDGTLTLAAHDFDDIRQALQINDGTPILEAIAAMPPSRADATRRHLHAIEMEIAHQSKPQPDAATTLASLQQRGFKLGILTRNAEDIAEATLSAAGLSQFFSKEEIIGRDSCAPKPDPEGIFQLLSHWQADATQSAMVGDYLFDLDAGRNANVTTVHFSPEGDFLWPEKTDVTIRSLSELTDHLG